jgi:hypothetical protein
VSSFGNNVPTHSTIFLSCLSKLIIAKEVYNKWDFAPGIFCFFQYIIKKEKMQKKAAAKQRNFAAA